MLFYTAGQAQVFLALLAAGAALGAWYDFLRRAGLWLCAGRALTAFLDFLFALGLFVVLALALFKASRMEIRLYALLGAACGMALYLAAVTPALDALFRALARALARLRSCRGLKKIFQFLCR